MSTLTLDLEDTVTLNEPETPQAPEEISDCALCSLEDVKEYIGGEANESTADDELLTRLVNASSDLIQNHIEREVRACGTNPATREFGMEAFHNGFLYIGDASEISSVSLVDEISQDVIEVFDLADVIEFPRNRRVWEPITRLKFRNRPYLWSSNYPMWSAYGSAQVVRIHATWGFPAVPEEIRQAAIVTTNIVYARDVERFSGTFSITEDRVELPRSLPSQVVDTLNKYRFEKVG